MRSRLRLLPAPADTGIVFRRTDLDNFEIEAHVRNVARVSYATSLMKHSVLISTTEHLLAALYSCEIDNVYVELDALELPILDGSSKPFIDMLERAGTRRLRRHRRYLRVVKPLEFTDGDRRIGIYPASEFRVHCFADYGHPAIGPQEIEMTVNRQTFTSDLAAARTFGFVKDFAQLQEMGLIRGGSLANALVLDDTSLLNSPCAFPTNMDATRRSTSSAISRLSVARFRRALWPTKRDIRLHTQLVTRLLEDHSSWTETLEPPAPSAVPSRAVAISA